MTILEISLIVIALLLLFILVVSLRFNYKFAIKILNVQDAIEQSLDIFDERFESLSTILEKPIFFDSVEVRQTVEDIRITRDAVLYVANALAASIDEEAIEEVEIEIGD